ncbi:MAG: hypothetical protein ACKVRP_01885 [Bacteroidota bacterium]
MTIIVWAVFIVLAATLLYAIVSGKMSGEGSAAAMTAFHDMQPRDKRAAVEIVIEQKAGARLFEQSNGEPRFSAPNQSSKPDRDV